MFVGVTVRSEFEVTVTVDVGANMVLAETPLQEQAEE